MTLLAIVPIWPLAYSSKPLPSIVALAVSVAGAADSTFSVASGGAVAVLPWTKMAPLPARPPTVSVTGAERPPVNGPRPTVPVLVSVPATVTAEPPSLL